MAKAGGFFLPRFRVAKKQRDTQSMKQLALKLSLSFGRLKEIMETNLTESTYTDQTINSFKTELTVILRNVCLKDSHTTKK